MAEGRKESLLSESGLCNAGGGPPPLLSGVSHQATLASDGQRPRGKYTKNLTQKCSLNLPDAV